MLQVRVKVAGRDLEVSPVFDTYWRFASLRQQVYEARLGGLSGPWTDDPILAGHRFTNCFRASDRVSQYLIRDVIYSGSQEPEEVVFRTLLFKFFNRIETWELLRRHHGDPSWANFDLASYDQTLTTAFAGGTKLYSAAYVIPSPNFGEERKHSNHLRLLEQMMTQDLVGLIEAATSLESVFETLRSFPSIGGFLAFQFAIDLNYSDVVDFDEMDFVVAGPGAKDGIRKCFGSESDGIEKAIIEWMTEHQNQEFDRLGLGFNGLFGRELQLIDCQNLFCEVDKYARIAHPSVRGVSGRTRIKQRFTPLRAQPTAWFPPKWRLGAALS